VAHVTTEASLGSEVLAYPPPPAFCKKSLQTIENTGRGSQKEGQETSRVCKSMGAKELAGWKGRERVVCRGNMTEDIILVYWLSSDFWRDGLQWAWAYSLSCIPMHQSAGVSYMLPGARQARSFTGQMKAAL